MSELPRYARYPKNSVITVLATENPKNKGTLAFQRFALYQSGMTIAEYVAAGGRTGDIKNDVASQYISVELPAEA
jgi:hypothetical protein